MVARIMSSSENSCVLEFEAWDGELVILACKC